MAAKQRPQVGPVHVAHGDEEATLRLARLVDRHDVGMVEGRREARLAQQALAEALIPGEIRAEDLERNRPVEARVAGEVDLAHAAAADQLLDLVGTEHPVHGPILLLPSSAYTGRG